MARKTIPTSKQRALLHGYRSGLEDTIAEDLTKRGVPVVYEAVKIAYTPPQKTRTYTPDFVLPNFIIIESKGRFTTEDRQKHKFIKDEHPGLDIRFVFSRSATRLSKGSPTTYADWCRQYGFLFADRVVPEEWVLEGLNITSRDALEAASPTPKQRTRGSIARPKKETVQ